MPSTARMNGSAPTLWLNVTTTVCMTGQPMGIMRVERSLARELPGLCGDRLRFCIWKDGDFVEWRPPESDTAGLQVEPAVSDRTSWADVPYSRRAAIGDIGKALITLAPRPLQSACGRLLVGLRDICRAIRRKTAGRLAVHRPPSGEIFQPGDVLLSLGLDWTQPAHKHFAHLRDSRRMRVATWCHDLIPVLYPQYCAENLVDLFTSYFLSLATSSDLIFCSSRRSESDLRGFLEAAGRPVPRTHVAPLGDSVSGGTEGAVSDQVRKLCEEPFILFVSTIERRKNHEVLYRAYHLLCAAGHRARLPKLLFVGALGWGVDDFLTDLELDPLTRGLIAILDRVSDRELAMLYAKARFCVYPSFYEGWGLPVAEALAAGKLVLASNRGSLPEVGGDLVRYVDPWNPHEWAREIWELSTNDALREELCGKVRAGYKPRTWADTARVVKEEIGRMG